MHRLFLHASCAAQAEALAQRVAADVARALDARARALLVVSGGRSPVALFNALSETPLDWQRVDVSLADERWVPQDHPDSNARLLREHLLRGCAAAASLIALADTRVSLPEQLARLEADARLRDPAAVVLGMGEDRHTASLFPDAPEWPAARDTAARFVSLTPAQAPHRRVSLSLAALRAAPRLYLQIAGEAKRAALGVALAAREDTPVSLLAHDEGVDLHVHCCPE